jgi:hypothetical protein
MKRASGVGVVLLRVLLICAKVFKHLTRARAANESGEDSRILLKLIAHGDIECRWVVAAVLLL